VTDKPKVKKKTRWPEKDPQGGHSKGRERIGRKREKESKLLSESQHCYKRKSGRERNVHGSRGGKNLGKKAERRRTDGEISSGKRVGNIDPPQKGSRKLENKNPGRERKGLRHEKEGKGVGGE